MQSYFTLIETYFNHILFFSVWLKSEKNEVVKVFLNG